jgi:hypothetical protein
MHKVSAYAVREGKSIEVTVSGYLPDSCHEAKIQDIYPGGSRTGIIDPGAAQVFIEETVKTGSGVCLIAFVPWAATVVIPDRNHTKVEIFVNNKEALEVGVVGKEGRFIVIALTGFMTGCSIIPKDALYPAIYSRIFGPATYAECESWVVANCRKT